MNFFSKPRIDHRWMAEIGCVGRHWETSGRVVARLRNSFVTIPHDVGLVPEDFLLGPKGLAGRENVPHVIRKLQAYRAGVFVADIPHRQCLYFIRLWETVQMLIKLNLKTKKKYSFRLANLFSGAFYTHVV